MGEKPSKEVMARMVEALAEYYEMTKQLDLDKGIPLDKAEQRAEADTKGMMR